MCACDGMSLLTLATSPSTTTTPRPVAVEKQRVVSVHQLLLLPPECVGLSTKRSLWRRIIYYWTTGSFSLVIPQLHLTATLLRPSETLNLVWSLSVAAWSRSIAVLRSHQNGDRNRSQRFCATRNANRPTVLRLYNDVCDRSLYSLSLIHIWRCRRRG